jgi:hypothetical protein
MMSGELLPGDQHRIHISKAAICVAVAHAQFA